MAQLGARLFSIAVADRTMLRNSDWNPFSTQHWAQWLGLAHVPLFGAAREQPTPGDLAVLLDGRRSSLAVYCPEDVGDLLNGPEPLSWSWSANVRHALIANRRAGTFVYRRWDAPSSSTKFSVPRTPADATKLFEKIGRLRTTDRGDVIGRLLSAFRIVRSNLAPYSLDPLNAIRVFNAFLVGTERVRAGEIDSSEWLDCHTVRDALGFIPHDSQTEIERLPEEVLNAQIADLLSIFVEPDPLTDCSLEPDLLIRHASGILYQEAHFELEREIQGFLPGWAGEGRTKPGSREARFTPPALARAMVQQALRVYDAKAEGEANALVVMDPACGSSIFLQHAIQELVAAGTKRPLELIGMDTSAVSCAISRFCLSRARRDAQAQGVKVDIEILETDALRIQWPHADVILSNPPFAAWNKMSAHDRESVVQSLGRLFKGHPDKAMAFVWRSVESMRPGGSLACIVPSPFLESSGGADWRAAMLERTTISLIGRFRGYSFFQNALVEPAFIVLRRKEGAALIPTPLTVLIAQDGGEDESLRALRRDIRTGPDEELFSIFTVDSPSVDDANWLPRSQKTTSLVSNLAASGIPTVGDLFKVRQGIRTGDRAAFLLTRAQLRLLPERERRWFKPAAGTSTIREARIFEEEYVFFPYGEDGDVLIPTLDELQRVLPDYFEKWLLPRQKVLSTRTGIKADQWWLLTRERQWQSPATPKIITAAFGDRGSFAFDADGRFAVVQGWAWLWSRGACSAVERANDGEEDASVRFHEGGIPWAYTAILNSAPFEILLSHFCPRVQGGQYHLDSRFVGRVFLPDLLSENEILADCVHTLESAGKALSRGDAVDLRGLDKAAAQAYGTSISEWDRARDGR
jgi:hypothetical protein